MVALVAAGASKPQKPACSPGPSRLSSSPLLLQPSYPLCEPRPPGNLSVPIAVYRAPECQAWLQEVGEGEGDETLTSSPSPCQGPVITVRPKEKWGQP